MNQIGRLDTTHDMYLPGKRAKARHVSECPPAPNQDQPLYTVHEARRLTRVSLRQLQWWDEKAIVSPIQEGHKRRYTETQVEELRRIKALRDAGVGLLAAKRYLKWRYTAVLKITGPTVINGTLVVPK